MALRPTTSNASATRSHIALDLVTIGLLLIGLETMIETARAHLPAAIGLAVVLQVVALGATGWMLESRDHPTEASSAGTHQMMSAFTRILGAGAFLWVAFAWLGCTNGESPSGHLTYWAHITIALLGGVTAVAGSEFFGPAPRYLPQLSTGLTLLYVTVIEATLLACLATGHVSVGMVLVSTLLSYLPVRMQLALSADGYRIDMASGLAAYGNFCWLVVTYGA